MSRLILRVVDAAGARGNSPACGGLKQVRALFLGPLADARRGTKGNYQNLYSVSSPPKGLPEASRSAIGASLITLTRRFNANGISSLAQTAVCDDHALTLKNPSVQP